GVLEGRLDGCGSGMVDNACSCGLKQGQADGLLDEEPAAKLDCAQPGQQDGYGGQGELDRARTPLAARREAARMDGHSCSVPRAGLSVDCGKCPVRIYSVDGAGARGRGILGVGEQPGAIDGVELIRLAAKI